MMRVRPLIFTVSALLLFAAPAQAAKISSTATVELAPGGARVVVTISSKGKVAKSKQPRSVVITAAGKKSKASKVKTAKSAGYRSVWRSKVYKGALATKLNSLGGKRIRVTATSKSGKKTYKPKVTVQSGGGGVGQPAALFALPPGPLTGEAAWNHIKGYLLNSAFSDCAAGVWPNCAVENRYVHCPDFSWQYRRATPSNGADINSYYAFTVTGVEVAADGSWGVQYNVQLGPGDFATYLWRVSQSGIANGEYQYGSNYQTMPNYFWSQPAITWDRLNGAC